jgi:queuine tRNA-ribosyltransferase
MGVGRPDDILGAVARGIDMFDCVLPTRMGRTGKAFTRRGEINMRNARHAEDPRPIDEACACPACTRFTRAYIHHLFKAGEMLGPMLLTRHNLQHYQDLMRGIRDAVAAGRFAEFAASARAGLAAGDVAPPARGAGQCGC